MLDLVFIFLATLVLFLLAKGRPKNYPPGPPCLPLVGCAPFVPSQNFHFYLEEARGKYGPVIGFKFGPRCVVGVCGVEEVREVLGREEFQGRPKVFNIEPGIMFNEGEPWAAQRRFTVRHLRDFGFGKKTVEHVVAQEAAEFFENVLGEKEVVQVTGLFTVSIINVLWAMMGGRRFSHEDAEFKNLLDGIFRRFRSGNPTGGLSDAIPVLKFFFSFFGSTKKDFESDKRTRSFLEKAIAEHKKTKTETPRDFIDVYLDELQKPEPHSSFSEETLRNVCFDFFSAGSESIANSLSFCLLYCVLYPEWQEAMHQQIRDCPPSEPYLANTEKLPKVEAFISEVSRCNPIASLTVPHRAVEDTELKGYSIPKNSMVLVSLWSVLQDKKTWGDPENFRPERFLDERGQFVKNVAWLPIFGSGKRACPGEMLSRHILFVYLILLIRKFRFSLPEGQPKPSTVCMPGFTHSPQPFLLRFTKR